MRIAVRAAEIAADWTQLKSLDAKAESGTNAMKAVTKVVPALRNKLLSEVLIYFFLSLDKSDVIFSDASRVANFFSDEKVARGVTGVPFGLS